MFSQDYDQIQDSESDFLAKYGLQDNSAFPATAFDLSVFGSEADILKHLSPFEGSGGTFNLQVLDHLDRISIVEDVSVAVFYVHGYLLEKSGKRKVEGGK